MSSFARRNRPKSFTVIPQMPTAAFLQTSCQYFESKLFHCFYQCRMYSVLLLCSILSKFLHLSKLHRIGAKSVPMCKNANRYTEGVNYRSSILQLVKLVGYNILPENNWHQSNPILCVKTPNCRQRKKKCLNFIESCPFATKMPAWGKTVSKWAASVKVKLDVPCSALKHWHFVKFLWKNIKQLLKVSLKVIQNEKGTSNRRGCSGLKNIWAIFHGRSLWWYFIILSGLVCRSPNLSRTSFQILSSH